MGLVRFAGLDRAEAEPRLARAIEGLRPRGPDGEGRWFDGRCALGHTRLAIVDRSPAAAQPMAREGLVVVFNGEIHNHTALRTELEALGHAFATRSDTEVLLAGWRAWGAAMLPRLSGMFAFALWDTARARLVLARDRFGEKPLAYAPLPGGIAFASDLVALGHARGTAGTLDLGALRHVFALKYVPEPLCILQGAEKVPAGHWLEVDAGGRRLSRWYEPAPAPTDLVTAFDAAVADRLIADVPVGAYLSGGVDSALVVASMTRQARDVRTFTVGYADAPAYYDERAPARALAARLGARHEEIVLDAVATNEALDRVFDAYDEPFADASAVPSWLLARHVRAHVGVALSGDGGDELFAGYVRHMGERYAGLYGLLPGPLRRGLIEPWAARLKEGAATAGLRRARRVRRFVAEAAQPPLRRQVGWARIMSDAEIDKLLIPRGPAPDVDALYERARAGAEGDAVAAMLLGDLLVGLPGDMLVKVDRASMAHGLEVRCPFLDHRVAGAALALPSRARLGWRRGKLALRRAFADRLPAEVFARPKRGFELPIAAWLTGPLADRLARALDPALLARQGLIRPDPPRLWRDELAAGRRDTAERLWTLVAFQAWAERQGFC